MTEDARAVTRRYLLYILGLTGLGAAAALALGDRVPVAGRPGLLLGLGLAAAGALSWIAAAAWSIGRSAAAFLAAQVLGILGRLVIYGATLIYVAIGTTIDPRWTAGALVGFYVFFMVLEVRFALVLRRAAVDPGRSGGATE